MSRPTITLHDLTQPDMNFKMHRLKTLPNNEVVTQVHAPSCPIKAASRVVAFLTTSLREAEVNPNDQQKRDATLFLKILVKCNNW